MKGWKHFSVLRAMLAFVLMAAFAATAAMPASAQEDDDPIGGGGGGGGGGATATGLHWRVISGPNAWAQFASLPSYVWGMDQITISDEDLALCQASENVWFVIAANMPYDNWMANAWSIGSGDAIVNFAHNGHDIYSPRDATASSASFNDAITEWNAGNSLWLRERTTLVCSGTMGELQTVTETEYNTESETSTVTGIYGYNTSITPQFSANSPLEAQSGTPLKTSFGDLFDTYFTIEVDPITMTYTVVPKGGTILPDDLVAQAEAAIAADTAMGHQTVDLSPVNQAGMADGGVLNFNEFTQEVSITASSTQYEERYRECDQISTDGGVTWTTLTCGPWSAWTEVDDVAAVPSATAPIQYQTGFWQMISVHCNLPGFQDLMDSVTGETVVSTGDGNLAATATSRVYTTQPAVLDFGQPGTPSADRGFFDKECSIECVADPDGANATAANGAVSNARATDPDGGTVEKYGATADGVNGNYMEFFRDNQPNDLTLDVWYPSDGTYVDYDGHAPLTTTVSRWAEGTPSIDGSGAGTFILKDAEGNSVFNSTGNTLTQTNWHPTAETPESDYLVSSPTSGVLAGLHRDFTAQATWASDSGAPQVLNFKWEYAPLIRSYFPTTGLGFTTGSAKEVGASSAHWSNVEVECYAQFGQDTSVDTTLQVHGSTGTGTTNTLDDGLLNHSGSSLPDDNANNLFIQFVRSTTE